MFTRSSSFPRGFFLGRGGFLVFFLALWGSRCDLIFLSELSFHFFLSGCLLEAGRFLVSLFPMIPLRSFDFDAKIDRKGEKSLFNF